MNPYTGEYVETGTSEEERAEAARLLKCERDDLLLLQGSLNAVEELSRRVRLGDAELAKRAKRRKTQRESRRRNRT